jgi:hypothetical protein
MHEPSLLKRDFFEKWQTLGKLFSGTLSVNVNSVIFHEREQSGRICPSHCDTILPVHFEFRLRNSWNSEIQFWAYGLCDRTPIVHVSMNWWQTKPMKNRRCCCSCCGGCCGCCHCSRHSLRCCSYFRLHCVHEWYFMSYIDFVPCQSGVTFIWYLVSYEALFSDHQMPSLPSPLQLWCRYCTNYHWPLQPHLMYSFTPTLLHLRTKRRRATVLNAFQLDIRCFIRFHNVHEVLTQTNIAVVLEC